MKVLLFGSSLCRDLYSLDEKKIYKIGGETIEFKYSFHPGKSFEFFLNKPHLIEPILKQRGETPDIVLVILGGNSISTIVEPKLIFENTRKFYSLLRDKLNIVNPKAKIIACEVPMRYIFNNFKNTPRPHIFRNIRHRVNRKLRDIKSKD